MRRARRRARLPLRSTRAIPCGAVSGPDRRACVAISLAIFACYAWFHQGGGWNPNVRFDQTRAIVEAGTLQIGDYLLYTLELDAAGDARYRRVRLSQPDERTERVPRLNSGDVTLHEGRFYPNKPPGTSLLAVPAYAGLLAVEGALLGAPDPDAWLWLTANAYLTRVLSVGLISALGAGLFFVLLCRLFPESGRGVRVSAAFLYALGTLVFPYATMLVDHTVVASLGVVALLFVLRGARSSTPSERGWMAAAAGLTCGVMLGFNYTAVLLGATIGLYAAIRLGDRWTLAWFAAGAAAPVAGLLAYHAACFGSPFAVAQEAQPDAFRDTGAAFGMFGLPDPRVLPDLLFLPYRGLFFSSPILLASFYGLVRMWRGRAMRWEVALVGATSALFLGMNASFNGWHGGASFGPRYLIPALPFLCIPLVPALERLRGWAWPLAAVSIATMWLATAVSPHTSLRTRNPLTEFHGPLVLGGTLEVGGYVLEGPVSVYPLGVAGGEIEVLTPTTKFAVWNSFNLGELVLPRSRWSVLPPLALAAGVWLGLCRSGREDGER